MSLPVAANLTQLRKQAKELAKADGVALSLAQLALARRHGFQSWVKLRAYVMRVEGGFEPPSRRTRRTTRTGPTGCWRPPRTERRRRSLRSVVGPRR